MKKSVRRYLVVSAFAGVGVFLIITRISYRPKEAIVVAQTFVTSLRSSDLDNAYALTEHRGDVGATFEDFRAVVKRECSHFKTVSDDSVWVNTVWPLQSYGNRLRRWMNRRQLDVPEIHIEFSIDGLPFEVREKKIGKEWRVIYFQTHAG